MMIFDMHREAMAIACKRHLVLLNFDLRSSSLCVAQRTTINKSFFFCIASIVMMMHTRKMTFYIHKTPLNIPPVCSVKVLK